MNRSAWPKPGERWHDKQAHRDVLIVTHYVDEEEHVWFQEITSADSGTHEGMNYDTEGCDVNSFLEKYEKTELDPSDALTRQIDVKNTEMHLMINSDPTRVPRLVVRVENPEFRTCGMELHESIDYPIDDWNPFKSLAEQSREHIRESFFGDQAQGPDFPETVNFIEEIARDRLVKRAFIIGMKKSMEAMGLNTLRTEIKKAMIEFDGNDRKACENLIESLSNHGFKDAEELVRITENPEITLFMDEIWAPLQAHLQMVVDSGSKPQFLPVANDGDEIQPG